MKFLLTLSSFIIIFSLASCNNAQERQQYPSTIEDTAAGSNTRDTVSMQTEKEKDSLALKEFQDAVDSNLSAVDAAKQGLEDSIAVQTNAVMKRDLQKAKLNLTYLANALIRSKVNYLVTDLETLNGRLQADLAGAADSFKKLTSIATTLTKINNSINLLVQLGKTLITRRLV